MTHADANASRTPARVFLPLLSMLLCWACAAPRTTYEGRTYTVDLDTDPTGGAVYVVLAKDWSASGEAGGALDESAVASLALKRVSTPALDVSLRAREHVLVTFVEGRAVTLPIEPKANGERFTVPLR